MDILVSSKGSVDPALGEILTWLALRLPSLSLGNFPFYPLSTSSAKQN